MPDDIDLTVAICTRNRPAQLRRLLASLLKLRRPEGATWELLIVNNGDPEASAAITGEWREVLPLRIVEEPVPGLSNARNTAVAEARGRYICWTDDDVIVPGDWLEVYWRAFRAYPEAAVFGGRIEPRLEGLAPAWFRDHMRHWPLAPVVCLRDLGPSAVALRPHPAALPWGANYAVRAREQRSLRYDPALPFGEETDLVRRLLAGGACGWWVPGSRIEHVIESERLSRAYVGSYYRRAGWAAAHLGERAPGGEGAWVGTGLPLLRLLILGSGAAGALLTIAGAPRPALRWHARSNYLRGILRYRRRRPPV